MSVTVFINQPCPQTSRFPRRTPNVSGRQARSLDQVARRERDIQQGGVFRDGDGSRSGDEIETRRFE